MKRSYRTIAAGLLGLGACGIVYWAGRVAARRGEQEVAALRQELTRLQGQLEDARRALALPPPEPAAEPPDETRRADPRLGRPAEDETTRRELVKLLGEKNDRIRLLDEQVAALERRSADLEARVAVLTEDSRRLAGSEADLKDRLDTATRLNQALQTEMNGRNERLTQLETSSRQLRRQADEMTRRLERLARVAEELEDLARRREMYLTNILRRYREVTDLYRALSVRTDSGRDESLPTGTDLGRVQNAISLADEDLKQLNSLNIQASRLQKELSAARTAVR